MQLQYKFDDAVSIDGKAYTVNASFDNILRVKDLMRDKAVLAASRVTVALQMLIGSVPEGYEIEELNDILTGILASYVEVAPQVTYDIEGNEMLAPETPRSFDFNKDAELIYASFYMAYHMDLIELHGKLHWSKFIALFQHLPETTPMRQVMKIRTWTPHDDKRSREQQMSSLKSHYSLDTDEREDGDDGE